MDALSRNAVREIDRRAIEDFNVPGVVLMENAGRGTAELLRNLLLSGGRQPPESSHIAICCGKGNNAGDGFVIARHLDNHGVQVKVLLFCIPGDLQGDARINFDIIARSKLPVMVLAGQSFNLETLRQELAAADWIVDALLGTGLSGPVRPPYDQVIDAINAAGKAVLAVDIPSGLDCDTGEPLGSTIRAMHTVTFVAPKKGFLNPDARAWTGEVHVVGIGAPRAALPT